MKNCGSRFRGKNRYTRDELVYLAKQNNIPRYSKMNMDELCAELKRLGILSPRKRTPSPRTRTPSPRKKCGKQYKPRERYSLSELKEMAKKAGIKGYSRLNMDELCAELKFSLKVGSIKTLTDKLINASDALSYLETHRFPELKCDGEIYNIQEPTYFIFRLSQSDRIPKQTKKKIIKLLVDKGIHISAFFGAGMRMRPEYYSEELINMALDDGINPNVVTNNKYYTPLYQAIAHPDATRMGIVKSLLKHGADPNYFNPIEEVYQQTLLRMSPLSHRKAKKLISWLIEAGADPNTVIAPHDRRVITAPGRDISLLELLIKWDMTEKAIYILNEGAVPDYTSLLAAIRNRNYYIVNLLINRGADPNENEALPLRVAITENNPRMVKLLLDKGANPNILVRSISNNYFPIKLALAQRYINIDIVKLFLEYGAYTDAENLGGESLYDYITRILTPDEPNPGWQSVEDQDKVYYYGLLKSILEQHELKKLKIRTDKNLKRMKSAGLKAAKQKKIIENIEEQTLRPGGAGWARIMGELTTNIGSPPKTMDKCLNMSYVDPDGLTVLYDKKQLYSFALGMGLMPDKSMSKKELCRLITTGIKMGKEAPF